MEVIENKPDSRMVLCERLTCVGLVLWLQLVGWSTNSVLHHVIHAAPIIVLLLVPPSPFRHFTGFLAGFLWVFMLAAVTPMIYESIVLGGILSQSHIPPYFWLAPIAAVLALLWAAANLALLHSKSFVFGLYCLVGIAAMVLFAWLHPYLGFLIGYPLDRTLNGQYVWIVVLLVETLIVLGLPSLYAYRLLPDRHGMMRFIQLQTAYWVFFVLAMVAGLHPSVNR